MKKAAILFSCYNEEQKKEGAIYKRNRNNNWETNYIGMPLTTTVDKITMILNPVDHSLKDFMLHILTDLN